MNAICLDSLLNTRIIAEKKTDILLHLLAHYDINSVASNFDKHYVQHISDLKGEKSSSLQEKLKEINEENLVYLSFMPAFFSSIDSLFKGLSYLSSSGNIAMTGFTETEIHGLQLLQNMFTDKMLCGLIKFSEIAESEYDTFFSSYWDNNEESYRKEMQRFVQIWETEENIKILTFLRSKGIPSIDVYLSEAMRRNGRGTRTDDSTVCAIARIPSSNTQVFKSYYIAVHELLHQVIDGVTQNILKIDSQQRSLNPDDEAYNIHEQIENSVITAQHLLMGYTRKMQSEEYYALVSEIGNAEINNEVDFYANFSLCKEMKQKLESMII